MSLTAAERIILHISEHWRVADAVAELTQKGIAEGSGVRRSHVPRNLKKLTVEGFIDPVEGRMGGHGRKVNYYKITEAGLRMARELRKSLLSQTVMHAGKETTVGEVATQFGLTALAAVLKVDESGTFHPPTMALQVLSGLIERDADMAFLKKWAREGGPVMVVYGAVGMGKTALGRALISHHRGSHVWIDITDDEDMTTLLSDLVRVLGIAAKDDDAQGAAVEEIKSRGILVVIDGYNKVSEDVVDFLSNTVSRLTGYPGKILVLAQEQTPSYCRFYGRNEVAKGDVWEHRIKGLSVQGCKKMLGAERIDEEALKRIYLLTKGTPLYLDLIRRGDAAELLRRSRFTAAEIRLLLYSKDVSSRQ